MPQPMRGHEVTTPSTARYTSTDTGEAVVGDVVQANGTTVYVRWRSTGRVEPVSRRHPDGVTFHAAEEA